MRRDITIALALATVVVGAGWVTYKNNLPAQPSPLEQLQSHAEACATLQRAIRSMAAESIADDYISDIERKARP